MVRVPVTRSMRKVLEEECSLELRDSSNNTEMACFWTGVRFIKTNHTCFDSSLASFFFWSLRKLKQPVARLVLSQGFLAPCRVSLSWVTTGKGGQTWLDSVPGGTSWRQDCPQPPVSSQMVTLGDSLLPLYFCPLYTPFLATSLTVFHSPQYDNLGYIYWRVMLLFIAVKKLCLTFFFFASCYCEGPGWPSRCLLRMFRLRKQSKVGRFVQESWSWPHLSLQMNQRHTDLEGGGCGSWIWRLPSWFFFPIWLLFSVCLFYLMAKIPGGIERAVTAAVPQNLFLRF